VKTCSKCLIESDDCGFYKNKAKKDGLSSWCKKCTNTDNSIRIKKNPEPSRKAQRARRVANPKKYDSAAIYRNENKKMLSDKYLAWREQNPEKQKSATAKWRLENYDSVLATNRNRRSKKKYSFGSHTSCDIILIFDNQRGLCANCKSRLVKDGKNKYHVDHIMPLALGGSNSKSNLQCLCPTCNMRKGAKHPDEWAKQQGKLL